jgi:hypothetical protein
VVECVSIGSLDIKGDYFSSFSDRPCFLCGRETQDKITTKWVWVLRGGGDLALSEPDEDDEADAGFMGMHPVGASCARKARKAGALVVTMPI